MKSVAIVSLALVGGAVARGTNRPDRQLSDPRFTFPQANPSQILTAHDDEFGIVDVKTDIQTVVMPGNRGRVTIGRDDADNELDMHFHVPNNRGNFQVNDYTKTHDDFDDEFGIVNVKTDVQTVVMPGNRGAVTIGRDDADDELHMHFNVPNNRGNFEVNDYTVRKDAEDDEFGIVDVKTDIQTVVMPGNRGRVTIGRDDADDEFGIVNVKSDIQTVVMPGNRGPVTIKRDDADNELDMHFHVPNNRGNFQVNDYTKTHDDFDDEFGIVDVKTDIQTVVMPGNRGPVTIRRDAEDDEFGIVDVKTDIQTVVMPGNRGPVTIRRDDADNELDMHFNVPNNRGNFQVNDYTKTHDDEELFLHLDVKSDIQTVVMPGNRGPVSIKRDDADNELEMYFHVPNNRKNFVVNDYTVKKDAEDDEFGIVDVKTDIQTVVMPGNRGPVKIRRDDADDELHMHFNVPNNRGNFEVNDHTVKKDAEDDEFGVVDYDDEFAVTNSKRLHKDEIDLLASILKHATQDKEGNVIIDGVKIAKIPKQENKKLEVPMPKKFLAF
jgi:hypothetical protein